MNTPFHVIIPARYHSSRFPGKLMMEINGQTVIERVYRQALAAEPGSVTIATDHPEIAALGSGLGARVVMTASSHQSGSDRIAEVVAHSDFKSDDIIVNVQGDEPFIAPELIAQVAQSLSQSDSPVATLCWPIHGTEQLNNPNVVKVVRDCHDKALYFSRSAIPFCRDGKEATNHAFRHIGLYAYRASFLLDYVSWPVCQLESFEALEQLRILWSGYSMIVHQACVEPLQDINTPEDLLQAQRMLMSV